MSSKKFRVWEVIAYSSGTIKTVARFPFREKTEADELARNSLGGYVLPANLPYCLTLAEELAQPDAKPTEPQPTGTQVATPKPVPVPVPAVRVQQWV